MFLSQIIHNINKLSLSTEVKDKLVALLSNSIGIYFSEQGKQITITFTPSQFGDEDLLEFIQAQGYAITSNSADGLGIVKSMCFEMKPEECTEKVKSLSDMLLNTLSNRLMRTNRTLRNWYA
jgi:hypothetical protein